VALDKILAKQVEFMKPLASEYGVTIEIEPVSGPALVLGDEQTLEQVFANLISNAIKFNKPAGSVRISLREEDDFIAAEVKDTGIGIAKEHLPFIFDQFYRVRRGEGEKTKGSGLGLSIAKKIVEAHNGRIEVTSEPGAGTAFTVRLPKAS
jgi:two-component system phosphate regulon sensor histidine kinase PhoR